MVVIPKIYEELPSDFIYEELPTKTFKLNGARQVIVGQADELEAMQQAIYLILNIERYENLIYSWNYGIELHDLYGKSVEYVLATLEWRIAEALLQDTRITEVTNFDFKTNGNKIHVTFTATTVFGDIEAEKVVKI